MKAAMKVLNDSLRKPTFPKLRETTLRNAIGLIQQEWFKVKQCNVNVDRCVLFVYPDFYSLYRF